ncbi:MAG: hypothetical protein JWO52_1209, partial [Gammaproteobacteria bacterium]|nr:hypothetical protein [Gammaproteobacteria bacterium]
SLGRDAALLPFRDGVGAHAKPSSKLGLGQDPENRVKGVVVHLTDYIHQRLMPVNHWLIAEPQPEADHKRMVDTPRPEDFTRFSDWLEAVREARALTQRAVARIGGASPQAVTKWFKGGNVRPASLQKLATWAGADYSKLRLLLDGQPITTQKRSNGPSPLKSVAAQRIARKIDLLDGDDDAIGMIEDIVDNRLAKHAGKRKQG